MDQEGRFCALGVLREVAIDDPFWRRSYENFYGICKLGGLTDEQGNAVMRWNDQTNGLTLLQIADRIESWYP